MSAAGLVAGLSAAGLLAASAPVAATAQGESAAAGYGGFSSSATATPVRIEVHEPSIPIPADPQLELNAFYTHVQGSSGPDASARASALWPGDPVGTGLKTIGDQLGLPSQLTAQGYPLQTNAATPAGPAEASQEPLPGVVTRASADRRRAAAQAGISPDAGIPQGADDQGADHRPGPDPAKGDLLGGLGNGDLSALGAALTGRQARTPTVTSPLGSLGALVSADSVSSTSDTSYDGSTVTARATSRLHGVRLLGGLVRLQVVEVATTTTSDLHRARVHRRVRITGLSIAGRAFTVGPDGVHAAGKATPLPGLPDSPGRALEALGIGFGLPSGERSVHGTTGALSMRGLRITLDTSVLRRRLPALPLSSLTDNLPDQLGPLKTVLGALTQAAPKFVIYLGNARTSAETVAAPSLPSGPTATPPQPTPAQPAGTAGGVAGPGGSGSGGDPGTGPVSVDHVGGSPRAAGAPSTTTSVRTVSATPGLPPLGNVPTLLCLAGLALAAGAGWLLRRAGAVVLGAGATCAHGLKSGLPDLRKV